jgi:hypothetical protein
VCVGGGVFPGLLLVSVEQRAVCCCRAASARTANAAGGERECLLAGGECVLTGSFRALLLSSGGCVVCQAQLLCVWRPCTRCVCVCGFPCACCMLCCRSRSLRRLMPRLQAAHRHPARGQRVVRAAATHLAHVLVDGHAGSHVCVCLPKAACTACTCTTTTAQSIIAQQLIRLLQRVCIVDAQAHTRVHTHSQACIGAILSHGACNMRGLASL